MKLKKLAASLLAAAMLFCGTATTAFADGGCDGGRDDDLNYILKEIDIKIPGIDIDVEKTWDRGTAEGEIQLPDPGDVKVTVQYGNAKCVSVGVNWDNKDHLATVIPEKADSVTWKGEIDLENIIKAIIADIKNNIISSGGKAIQANGGFVWGDDLKEELKTILKEVITALTKPGTKIFGEEITGDDADQWQKSTTFKLCRLKPTLKLTNTYIGNNGDGGDDEEKDVAFTKVFEVADGYTIPEGANFTFTFTLTPVEVAGRKTGEGNTIAPVTIPYSESAVVVAFENVPAGTYKLAESYDGNWGTSIPNGVTVVVSENGTVTFGDDNTTSLVVTNTYYGDGYGEETFSITVTKEWDDANNKDGIRPSSVTVELLALEDGELKVVDSADLNAGKDWTHTFTVRKYKELAQLAVDDEFVEPDEIKYTIREESVPNGYTVSYKGLDKDDYVVFDDDEGSVIIKNSHTPTKEPTPIDRDDDDKEEKDDPDLTVRKVDKETDKLITEKATFRIYKLSGSRKLYYTGSSWSSNVEKAKEYSTKNGKFTAYDLGAGTYYIEEVKAPSGYNLADDLKVKLTSKDKTVEFANSKAKQNPNTGALVLPLDLADAAVAAMTLGAAAWVISKSKK